MYVCTQKVKIILRKNLLKLLFKNLSIFEGRCWEAKRLRSWLVLVSSVLQPPGGGWCKPGPEPVSTLPLNYPHQILASTPARHLPSVGVVTEYRWTPHKWSLMARLRWYLHVLWHFSAKLYCSSCRVVMSFKPTFFHLMHFSHEIRAHFWMVLK